MGVAGQPPLVAERLRERLAERDAGVFNRMMIVDMAIALGADGHIDERMASQLIEHVVEKADAGRNVGRARSVEVDGDLDARLLGFACDRALAHDDLSLGEFGLIASRGALGHLPRRRKRRRVRNGEGFHAGRIDSQIGHKEIKTGRKEMKAYPQGNENQAQGNES